MRASIEQAGKDTVVVDQQTHARKAKNSGVLAALLALGWFKTFSISAFMTVFFTGYLYLLKHPVFPVRTIPATWLDGVVSFQPVALPIYLSLWFYVSLPPALMVTRRDIVDYGLRIGAVCLAGFAVFYFWPNAIPPAAIDWGRYPSVAFLKQVDTAGNAFPSLHVATAVFSALWLHWRFARLRLNLSIRLANIAWCAAIAWSTLAVRQHVALDVYAGAALGALGAWSMRLKAHAGRLDEQALSSR
jgi:membrane-associated phospholipid phosphatase